MVGSAPGISPGAGFHCSEKQCNSATQVFFVYGILSIIVVESQPTCPQKKHQSCLNHCNFLYSKNGQPRVNLFGPLARFLTFPL